MSSEALSRLRKQVGGPRDGALLRVSIGNLLLASGENDQAVSAFREALEFDGEYAAAWKMLGQALTLANDLEGAIHAYERGIPIAERGGSIQAAREMQVFLRRLRKGSPS